MLTRRFGHPPPLSQSSHTPTAAFNESIHSSNPVQLSSSEIGSMTRIGCIEASGVSYPRLNIASRIGVGSKDVERGVEVMAPA